MSRPYTYRDVDLPEEWDEWPDDAKVNYLTNAMDRKTLMELLGEAADIPEEEVGVQNIHKAGIAHLLVTLTGGDDA